MSDRVYQCRGCGEKQVADVPVSQYTAAFVECPKCGTGNRIGPYEQQSHPFNGSDIPGGAGHRTLCEVLGDMRECLKTNNFSYLLGLIEEGQYRANRMENAIELVGGWGGVQEQEKRRIKLKKEIKELEEKRDKLKEEVPEEDEKK